MRNKRKHVRSIEGFSMVETMVVMAIFVIGILAVGEMQTRSVISNTVARESTHASALATDRMEKLISLPYEHPALLDRSGDGVLGLDNDSIEAADGCDNGRPPYTVYWNVAQIPTTPAPEKINYKRVRVIVTWMDRGGMRRYPLDTIKTDN